MRTRLIVLLLWLMPGVASAQTWGNAPFDAGYEIANAFDGDAATWWEGRCHPSLSGGCGARPLTAGPWSLGTSWSTAQTVTAVSATYPGAPFTPGSVSVQCSIDTAFPNSDGSNLTGWMTWTSGASCKHVRLLMTAAPGEGLGMEYPPAVAQLTITTDAGSGSGAPSSPPSSSPPPSSACTPSLGALDVMDAAFVGDSITALGWPEMLAFWRPALVVHNLAAGGATSAQMLATQLPAALASGAPAVAIGPCCWNDAASSIPEATTAANVRAMIQAAQAAGRTVLLVEAPPGGQGVDLAPQRAALLAVAIETCARYVPIWNALNNPDAPGTMLGTLRAEGAHPNAAGLLRIAERVAHSNGW